MTTINTFKIEERWSFPPKANPFHCDLYHMGEYIGSNCCIMFENHSDKPCKYLIIINTETGKRIKVSLTEE